MKIAFDPSAKTSENAYVSRMNEAIEAAYPGCEIVNLPGPTHLSALRSIDWAWVNWFENLSNYSLFSFIRTLVTKLSWLLAFKLCGVRLVVTFHNKRPHEMMFPRVNMLFMRLLLRAADRIVILSDYSRQAIADVTHRDYSAKIFKVSHPSYPCDEKVYPAEGEEKERVLKVFSFGVIRPYKNIELIIEAAKHHPSIEFTIAGNAGANVAYAEHLRDLTAGVPNIEIHVGYLSDDKINTYLNDYDILILPYNIKSSLNSGVALYAFSKGINTIIPTIGSVMELGQEMDNVFHYEYDDESDHLSKIDSILTAAEDEYLHRYPAFVARAKSLHDFTMLHNSIPTLVRQIVAMGEGIK
jgi:glycosyltransferase involved in cell wall biosynthesis